MVNCSVHEQGLLHLDLFCGYLCNIHVHTCLLMHCVVPVLATSHKQPTKQPQKRLIYEAGLVSPVKGRRVGETSQHHMETRNMLT